MNRVASRQTVFVCAGIINGELITETIPAATKRDANISFHNQFGCVPADIVGPFMKKKLPMVENPAIGLKFSNKSVRAIYGDWMVNAMFLTDPSDVAYLVFKKRVDGKRVPFPKGNITVPVSELTILKE